MKILKNYWKPTPIKMKKIGDALLASSLFALSISSITGQWWIISFAVVGIIGKFITNFYSKNETE